MVITSCPTPDSCTLSIAYNSQVPLCSSSPRQLAGPCRDPEALCIADPAFSFNLSTAADNAVRHTLLSPLH